MQAAVNVCVDMFVLYLMKLQSVEVNWLLQMRQQTLLTTESDKSSPDTDLTVETVTHTEDEPVDASCEHSAVSKVRFLKSCADLSAFSLLEEYLKFQNLRCYLLICISMFVATVGFFLCSFGCKLFKCCVLLIVCC